MSPHVHGYVLCCLTCYVLFHEIEGNKRKEKSSYTVKAAYYNQHFTVLVKRRPLVDIIIITLAKEEVRQSSMKWDIAQGKLGKQAKDFYPETKIQKHSEYSKYSKSPSEGHLYWPFLC